MKRCDLEVVLKSNLYLDNGTKQACIKAKEFLHNVMPLSPESRQINSPFSCVNSDEFIEAVNILIVFASSQKDQIPEAWNCDSYCKSVNELICPGECGIDFSSNKRCPFFVHE